MLTEIVETNDKRRFELSGDAELIRARQGHSVRVEADSTLAIPRQPFGAVRSIDS